MQEQAPITPAYDLGHYLRPLQRQRKWLLIVVAGGFILGTAFAVVSKPTYTAAARVQVNPPFATSQSAAVNPTNGRTPSATVNMDTESQNVKSAPVATAAQQILKTSTSPNALLSRITVTVPANTTILRIACGARSPGVAQTCANAFASAYLSTRAAGEAADINRQLSSANALIGQAKVQLQKDTTAGVNAGKGTAAKVEAFSRVSNDNATITTLTGQVNTLKTELGSLPLAAGNIQSRAGRGIASTANRAIPPITGLVLGLLVGVAAVYGRERFDRYVRHRDDLLREGVELVAELEPLRGRDAATPQRRENAQTRFDQRVASIVAGSFDDDGGIVYVACVSPGQANADIAGRLAATLASVGHHVEVVQPAAVQVMAPRAYESAPTLLVDEAPPLDPTAALLGWPSPEPAEPSTELVVAAPEPEVLIPVVPPAESVPLGIRMQLELARRRAQFVIIDGDPAVTDAQAYVLAGLSDATLLVVDPEATTRSDLAEVVDQLSVTGSELLGAAIWRPMRTKHRDTTSSSTTSARPWGRGRAEAPRPDSAGGPDRAVRATGADASSNGSGPSRPYRPVDAAR